MYLIKRKNGIYYIEFEDISTQTKRRVSTHSSNKKEALLFLSNFKQTKATSEKVVEITLQSFFDEYLNFIKITRSKKYAESVDLAFRHMIKYLGDLRLSKLTTRALEKFILDKYSNTQYGAAQFYKTIKASFNKAREWHYLDKNPMHGFKLPKMPRNLPATINETDLDKIVLSSANPHYTPIFIFAFYTGMRLSEIVNLSWQCIDLVNSNIFVKNTQTFQTKNKKERIVPMHPRIYEMLKEFPIPVDQTDYVFQTKAGVYVHSDAVSRNFKKTVISLGMNQRIHFHSLRHSFASCLAQRGVSLIVLKELLGHEDISTTMIYSHIQKENLDSAVKLLK